MEHTNSKKCSDCGEEPATTKTFHDNLGTDYSLCDYCYKVKKTTCDDCNCDLAPEEQYESCFRSGVWCTYCFDRDSE